MINLLKPDQTVNKRVRIKMNHTVHCWQSPIGMIRIVSDRQSIHQISFHEGPWESISEITKPASQAISFLESYFENPLICGTLPTLPGKSPFQEKIRQTLIKLTSGSTISYSTLAERIGNPKASRAVGRALATNPLLIFVPCHRVVGSTGNLTGFAGGMERKAWLLEHERQAVIRSG